MAAMGTGLDSDDLPGVSVRRLDAVRARAVLDARPVAGDRWGKGYPAEGDIDAARMAIRMTADGNETPFCAYEVLDVTGQVVGGAGFHGPPNIDGTVEIGYGIAPGARQRGYATSAIGALLDIARINGATSVVARTQPDNVPSRRALESAGFRCTSVSGGYAHHEYVLGTSLGK
jgi:L-amino acid N-acyltransferase YncA